MPEDHLGYSSSASKTGVYYSPGKSILILMQYFFLVFVISSLDMTISSMPEKTEKILQMVRHILEAELPLGLWHPVFIGLLVSSFLGGQSGPLFYQNLKFVKTRHYIMQRVILMLLLPLLSKLSQN